MYTPLPYISPAFLEKQMPKSKINIEVTPQTKNSFLLSVIPIPSSFLLFNQSLPRHDVYIYCTLTPPILYRFPPDSLRW